MNVNHLNCYSYQAPFKQPVETIKVRMTERSVLVISVDINGKPYFAESNAFTTDWYHHETIAIVEKEVRRIFNELKEMTFADYESYGRWLSSYRQAPHAAALFDCIGWQYFHDCGQLTVPVGYTVRENSTGLMNRVKVKWSEHIVETVAEIRRSYPDIRIAIDANGSLTEEDVPKIEACISYSIDYIEEPFSDIALYRKYRELPLAIDESAADIDTILRFVMAGVETIIVKYARLGGIYPALKLREALPECRFIAGGMYEYGLSKYFTAVLAEQFGTIPDLTPRGSYFDDDFSNWDESINNGLLTMSFPEVDEAKLAIID